MGMTAPEIQRLTGARPSPNDKNVLYAATVPSPNPEFESYHLIVSPTTGLCKIIGVGNTISSDAYGSTVQSHFQNISDALTAKYGTPTNEFDFLKSGSIWDSPREWMMSIRQNERTKASYWGGPEAKSRLPSPLSVIELSVSALDSSDGYLMLVYEFTTSDKCIDEIQRLRNSSL
jgi:hypothetical protein